MLRKILWWAAGIFALLAVLIVLFYAEEDWRGARDWAACQKELAAKGEILDLRELAPPGKPEDDLSKVPIFAPLYQEEIDPKAPINQIDPYLGESHSSERPKLSNYRNGKLLDISAWQKFYRSLPNLHLTSQAATPAQDILQALSRFDQPINEIDAALSNPASYWPINYAMPFETQLGGVTKLLRLSQVLQLRAISHLDNHDADLAEKDYLLSFHSNHTLTKSFFLVDYLVLVAVRAVDDAILWEGLHRHAWSDAQLREMESALASEDMLALSVDSLRMERGDGLQTFEIVREGRYKLIKNIHATSNDEVNLRAEAAALFLLARPSGWEDQESVFYTEEIQKRIGAIDLDQGTFNKQLYDHENNPKEFGIWSELNCFLPLLLMGPLDALGPHIAHAETNRRLEEYRLAHGQYPDTLEALPDLPAHLNQEVLSEQPLRYQRKGDSYLLYSVGWNQKDEGGVSAVDEKEGDWVWPGP